MDDELSEAFQLIPELCQDFRSEPASAGKDAQNKQQSEHPPGPMKNNRADAEVHDAGKYRIKHVSIIANSLTKAINRLCAPNMDAFGQAKKEWRCWERKIEGQAATGAEARFW